MCSAEGGDKDGTAAAKRKASNTKEKTPEKRQKGAAAVSTAPLVTGASPGNTKGGSAAGASGRRGGPGHKDKTTAPAAATGGSGQGRRGPFAETGTRVNSSCCS